jgi:hypothetical protein
VFPTYSIWPDALPDRVSEKPRQPQSAYLCKVRHFALCAQDVRSVMGRLNAYARAPRSASAASALQLSIRICEDDRSQELKCG